MNIIVTQMLETPEDPFSPTTLIDPWARKMIQEMKNRGHQVIHLVGPEDTKGNLIAALEQFNPQLYVNYGHGWEDTIIGQDAGAGGLELVEDDNVLATYAPLIDLRNSQVLSARMNYVVSCLTADQLGPDAVRKGAAGYIGYKDTFEFGIDGHFSADGFEQTANAGLLALLEGETLGEAHQISMDLMNQWIDYYYDMGGSVPTGFAALLKHNRDGLRCLGNRNAKLA